MMRIDAAVFTINKINTAGRIDQLKTLVNNKIIKTIANAEPTKVVDFITTVDGTISDSIGVIDNIRENVLSTETVSSVIDMVSDLGLNNDVFDVIKNVKDGLIQLRDIQSGNYDLNPTNVINSIDIFSKLGQKSFELITKKVGPTNIFSKILEINTTGHYVVASQVLWKIHTHAMNTASTFSIEQINDYFYDPETNPILFKEDIIKEFTVNNIRKFNIAINNARDRMSKKIDNIDFQNINLLKRGGKKKSRKTRRKLKKRSKRRFTRR